MPETVSVLSALPISTYSSSASMKTDGGDFVTGGNLGYMNFPSVDGGKGDPKDTVGNPGQYLSISSKATPFCCRRSLAARQ